MNSISKGRFHNLLQIATISREEMKGGVLHVASPNCSASKRSFSVFFGVVVVICQCHLQFAELELVVCAEIP